LQAGEMPAVSVKPTRIVWRCGRRVLGIQRDPPPEPYSWLGLPIQWDGSLDKDFMYALYNMPNLPTGKRVIPLKRWLRSRKHGGDWRKACRK